MKINKEYLKDKLIGLGFIFNDEMGKKHSTEITISEHVGSFQILDKLEYSSLNNEQIASPQQI